MQPSASSSPSTASPQVRRAGAADIEQLVRLINSAFVVEQMAIPGDRIDHPGVERYLSTGTFLVLEELGSLVGCVYVEKRGDRGYLGLLSVQPARQRGGVGRLLGKAAEKWYREQNCVAIELRVISARAELLHFYEKLGYHVTGESPMPPNTPLKIPCHFIHMSKLLRESRSQRTCRAN